MRSSHFLNMSVTVYNEENAYNITDMVTNFQATLTKNDPHQRITLDLSVHSDSIVDTQIGFFREKYVVFIELYDASQDAITDSIVFDLVPLHYDGFDTQGINRDSEKNLADMKLSIELLNRSDIELFKTYHNVFEFKQYKDLFQLIRNDWINDFVLEKDIDEPFGNKLQDQFFIPEMKWQDVIPYLMNKGYAGEGEPMTYFNTTEGLSLYRLEESKKRKKIETIVFPDRDQIKDFNEIFVEGFQLARIPKQRLYTGRKQRIFETSLNKNRILSPHQRDPKLSKDVWLPKYLEDVEMRNIETFDQYHNSVNAISSFYDGVRSTHKLHLTLTRWAKFEWFYPLRHIFQVSYTGKALTKLNDEFYVADYTLFVTRHKNEFVPRVDLTLDVIDVS